MLFRSFVIVKKSNEKTEKSNLFVHHSILSDQQFLLKRYFLTTGFKYICFLKRLISQQLYIFLRHAETTVFVFGQQRKTKFVLVF